MFSSILETWLLSALIFSRHMANGTPDDQATVTYERRDLFSPWMGADHTRLAQPEAGGGAHAVMRRPIDDHFAIRVPARAINPISKTKWEGAAAEPDVPVKAPEGPRRRNQTGRRQDSEELISVAVRRVAGGLAMSGERFCQPAVRSLRSQRRFAR
jgi:hypothetical protein